MNLLELVSAEKSLIEQLAASGGELPPEVEKALEKLASDIAVKTDSYVYVLRRLEDMEERLRSFEEMHARARRAVQNAKRRLKDFAAKAVEAAGGRVCGEEFQLVLVNTKPALEVSDQVPEEYFVEKFIREVDKAKILADLEAGISVPGAEIKTSKTIKIFCNTKGGKNGKK